MGAQDRFNLMGLEDHCSRLAIGTTPSAPSSDHIEKARQQGWRNEYYRIPRKDN